MEMQEQNYKATRTKHSHKPGTRPTEVQSTLVKVTSHYQLHHDNEKDLFLCIKHVFVDVV